MYKDKIRYLGYLILGHQWAFVLVVNLGLITDAVSASCYTLIPSKRAICKTNYHLAFFFKS